MMIVGRPNECTKPNCAATDWLTSAISKHPGRGRVFTGHAERRAPNDILAASAWHHQPRPRLDVGVGKVTNGGGIQIVRWIIDNVFRFYTIISGYPVQSLTHLPFMIGAIGRQDVQLLVWLQSMWVIQQDIVIAP